MVANAYSKDRLGQRISRRRALKGLSAAALLVGGAACTASTETPTNAPATVPASAPTGGALAATARPAPTVAPTPKRGGIFRIALPSGFPHMDPHQTSNSIAWGTGVGVWYSRVVKYDINAPQPATVPVPDLAESWDQPDDLIYVFKVRPNVKWQNIPPVSGRALTVDDILYSLDRIRTKGFPNTGLLQAIAKTEAVDRSTFKITLSAPSTDLLIDLGNPGNAIVAKEVVDQKGDLKEGPVIGTGAFLLDKLDPNGTTSFVRNPDYFLAGKPYLDGYQYTNIPDFNSVVSAFRAGNLDVIVGNNLTPDQVETLKRANPNFQFPMFRSSSGTELAMRLDRAPFNDLRVRQAMYKALDPATIIKTAFGQGWLSVVALPVADWVLPESELSQLYKRDVEGAKQLLKEAGFENGLDINLTYLASNPTLQAEGELVLAQLKDANIRAAGKPLDFVAFSEQIYARGDFDVYVGPGTGTLFSRYHSKGAQNLTKVNDPKLDQLIEQQNTLGRRLDQRKQVLMDLQRYIVAQAYVHNIHTYEAPSAFQPYVRDYHGGGALFGEPDRLTAAWFDK
jgi:ABC-type transport system substrate-binding protein